MDFNQRIIILEDGRRRGTAIRRDACEKMPAVFVSDAESGATALLAAAPQPLPRRESR